MPTSEPTTTGRLLSLDAYRGFIMLTMASAGFGLAKVAKEFPDCRTMQFMGYEFDHVAWRGCAFWDLIQPSFMFMVGVAMAYSYAGRAAKGQSYGRMAGHAAMRALVLTALGVFLASNWAKQTNFIFTNVLAQIGLGYFFLFLLWGRSSGVQLGAAFGILLAYWIWFYRYPAPESGFNYASVGLPADWQNLTGLAAHWDKNTNAAAAFDQWFLNLFPREKPFLFSDGGYQTLNFVPSLATMIFGLMSGEVLRSARAGWIKFSILAGLGITGIVIGLALDQSGICPSVKRIWTPSWAVFSAGWSALILAGFYAVVDLIGWRRWAFPLIVVGMNSIAMYMMSQLMKPWIRDTLKRHCHYWLQKIEASDWCAYTFDSRFTPLLETTSVLLVLWLICFWLYRQKIFFRI